MGYVNIRPITDGSEVSETYLRPPEYLSESKNVYPKCLGLYRDYGESIQCTPYIMPDTIFGMCIHASVWICLKILEKQKMIDKSLTIPEIQTLATGSPYTDKQGLLFVQTARLLRMCRTQAFYIINLSRNLSDEEMLMELYAYVESGLPVILGVDTAKLDWWDHYIHSYHSIVAIGHTMQDNKIDGFIFHDESRLPYQTLKKDDLLEAWCKNGEENHVREMLVAVPPEVNLPFYLVFQQFREYVIALRDRNIITESLDNLSIQPMLISEEDLIPYIFTTRNDVLLRAFQEEELTSAEKGYFWIMFLYEPDADRSNKEDAKAFFIRDATQKTDFRLIYLKNEKEGIYQLNSKFYSRKSGKKRKKKLE